jgi:hypothetical protein
MLSILLLFLQFVPSGGRHTINISLCAGISGSVTDCFTDTAVLSSPWTNSAGSGFTSATLSETGDGVVPTTSGQVGAAAYTSGAFAAAQSARILFSATGALNSQATGPCVRFDPTTGNAYCWLIGVGSVFVINAGNGGATPVTGCPTVSGGHGGDVFELSIDSGFVLTCKDVTSGQSVSGTDGSSTYAGGKAGIIVDQRLSTSVKISKWGGS